MDIFSLGKVVKTIILKHLQKYAHGHFSCPVLTNDVFISTKGNKKCQPKKLTGTVFLL